MYIHGNDAQNPVFLVDSTGEYQRNADGSYLLFDGEAFPDSSNNLITKNGYYLVDTNGKYLSATQNFDTLFGEEKTAVLSESEAKKAADTDKRNTLILVSAVVAMIALIAVGAIVLTNVFSASDTEEADTGATDTPTSYEMRGKEIRTAGPQPTPEETKTNNVTPPPEAFPEAGSADIPAQAIPMTTDSGMGIVTTPTGNITCAFDGDYAECRVDSWHDTQPYGRSGGENDDEWANAKVTFTPNGQISVGAVSDALPKIGRLEYGEMAYSGNWVCGSAENGLTCWNTRGGHGVFVNRDAYQSF